MTGSRAANCSRMAYVPSVEQSSTMMISRSIFSGRGAERTLDKLLSTTARSLYTGTSIDSFIQSSQYNDTVAFPCFFWKFHAKTIHAVDVIFCIPLHAPCLYSDYT